MKLCSVFSKNYISLIFKIAAPLTGPSAAQYSRLFVEMGAYKNERIQLAIRKDPLHPIPHVEKVLLAHCWKKEKIFFGGFSLGKLYKMEAAASWIAPLRHFIFYGLERTDASVGLQRKWGLWTVIDVGLRFKLVLSLGEGCIRALRLKLQCFSRC